MKSTCYSSWFTGQWKSSVTILKIWQWFMPYYIVQNVCDALNYVYVIIMILLTSYTTIKCCLCKLYKNWGAECI